MQVNRIVVGEADHHLPQRTVGPGILTQVDASRVAPVDTRRIEHIAFAIQHANPVGRQITRIVLDFRNHVLLEDGRRHGPGRVERDVGDFGLEYRRTAHRLADLHSRTPDRQTVTVHRHLVSGDIDDHKRALQFVQQPPGALHVDPHLIDPRLDRHVQRRQRRRPRHAIGPQVLLGLILLHRGDDLVVVTGFFRQVRAQVTARHQTRTQLSHRHPVHAGLERLPFSDFRPAARIMDLAQPGQAFTQIAVNLFLRRRIGECTRNVMGIEGGEQVVHVLVGIAAGRIEIPVNVQPRRIDFTPAQLQQRGDERAGRRHVEHRPLRRGRHGRHQRLMGLSQFGDAEIRRIQAVDPGLFEALE
ncbi:hypothetical protein D3C75_645010 [compost metagenome]